MRPERLNTLFAPVTSLSGVGPKQDKLLRYLLDRAEQSTGIARRRPAARARPI
jgi:hypothetical protein